MQNTKLKCAWIITCTFKKSVGSYNWYTIFSQKIKVQCKQKAICLMSQNMPAWNPGCVFV